VPPSLVRTHAPTKATTAPAVRPAARRPLSSAVAATPLRVRPRRVLPPLVCQHAPTQAAAAPAVRPAARRPPSSAAAATPLRVPRRVPSSRSRTHAPTQAAAAPAVRPAARRLRRPPQRPTNSGCRGECVPLDALRLLVPEYFFKYVRGKGRTLCVPRCSSSHARLLNLLRTPRTCCHPYPTPVGLC